MGFGGFMIGLLGYGAGILVLVNALVAFRDACVAHPDGKSKDGKTYSENIRIMSWSGVFSFLCFVVTWLILKI